MIRKGREEKGKRREEDGMDEKKRKVKEGKGRMLNMVGYERGGG